MADRRMQYNQIVAKAWGNDMFLSKLRRDPTGTLKQEGVELPAGAVVKIMEDSDSVVHFVLPKKPAGGAGKAEDFMIC
jgi:Nitrile hydratase, alpha chain